MPCGGGGGGGGCLSSRKKLLIPLSTIAANANIGGRLVFEGSLATNFG